MDRIKDCAPDISNVTQLATLRQNVRLGLVLDLDTVYLN